ncbi:MAG: hypothetical protein JWP25_7833 [Bradyrhizobium sp.]|nr:hypothetical protein [Bradyrhizobium sp.]
MLDLKTKADLQRLVDEGLEESLTLDYKDSRALTRDGQLSRRTARLWDRGRQDRQET